MTLSARTRLGPSEIPSSPGGGRMGEVYGAREIFVTEDLKSYADRTYYQVSSQFVSESAGK